MMNLNNNNNNNSNNDSRKALLLCLLTICFNLCPGFNVERRCSRENLFLQVDPQIASGWYAPCSRHSCRYCLQIDDQLSYEFSPTEDGTWTLVEQNFDYSINYTLKEVKDPLQQLKDPTNVKNKPRSPVMTTRTSAESGSLRLPHDSSRVHGTPSSPPLDFEETRENPSTDIKIYRPRRCRCTEVTGPDKSLREGVYTKYQRLDLVDWSPFDNVNCSFLHSYLEMIPPEYLPREFENYSKIPRRSPQRWKPEFYISRECALIFYREFDNIWVVDHGVDFCDSFESFTNYFMSYDAAPCVEFLPPRYSQSWCYYSRVPHYEDLKGSLYQCGKYLKPMKAPKAFSMECSSFDL